MTVQLGVLGPLILRDAAGAEVALASARRRRLLAALALRHGTPVARDVLADLVWDTAPPVDPAATLHTHIARLRPVLPPAVRITTLPGGYRLDVAAGALDVATFTAAAESLAELDAALTLWRGRPFADLDHPAADPEVGRLTALRTALRRRRAALLIDVRRGAEAVADLTALLAEEPLDETATTLLMRAHAAAGRPGEALAAFARLRAELAEQLGADPGADATAVHEELLRGTRPAPGVPASSFVGRAADLAAVVAAVMAHRIVTLVGPGGVGKTRLARHAAAALAPGRPDGVLRVELAGVTPEGVLPAVAGVLRLPDAGLARVVDLLAVRRALLVLDDAEHVLDAVAPLVEAVAADAPGMAVLVTSREALRADGEHVVPVRPLPPDAAARLLVDRIRAADPGADLDPTLVADTCARLDGLPLALELAAARVPAAGLAGLALDDPLDGLGHGRRTAGARHRSLRDVVDWSVRLLDGDQRTLFTALGVFAGAVDRTAVAAVCGPAGALPDLVDRSLVQRQGGFGMLDTVRAYAREQLAASPEAPALRRRHATWAVALVADAAAARSRPDEADALRRLDAHVGDVRRAHAHLVRHGPLADLLRVGLVCAELGYQRARGDLVAMAEEALGAAGIGPDGAGQPARHPLVPRLLGLSAMPLWQRGDIDGAVRRAEHALVMADRLGDPRLGRDAHETLANVALFTGDLAAGLRHGGRAAELAAAAGDDTTLLTALVDQSVTAAYAGDHDRAAEHESAATALAARMGSPLARGWAAYAAGERRSEAGYADAAPHLARAVALAEEVDAAFLAGVARHTLLTSASRAGGAELAPLLDTWHAIGAWPQLWVAVRTLAEALTADGRHADAGRLLGALRASPRAGRPAGADATRLATIEHCGRVALGPDFDAALATGAALGDTAAIALARRLAAGSR